MARFKLLIEYEGTKYNGWQVQKGQKSIQGAFFDACKALFGERAKFEFYGSGRTDSGVHALGQVAHLDVQSNLPVERIRMGLNDNLPSDINVLKVEKTDPQFHARFDAVERSYVYIISKRRSAFGKQNIWWIKDRLNVANMIEASECFYGHHDFRSFTDPNAETDTTLVNIRFLDIHETDNLIVIHIVGSHFLWKMVRRIVGTLVDVGRGNLRERDVAKMLTSFSPIPAKLTAPPSGLYLEHVYYKGERVIRGQEIIPSILRLA
ncbi:MAG: tRNA pseudouridine(38-40) synthase TruA [Bacteroidia bacterium]|nr:tRNA pseudouridine(38-40) synthase TruA [Bacteroidia bacterium]